MKPTFALDLTREAIALLHRTPKGWLTIGEVAYDAADLGEALDYLRKTALGLSPLGVASKVILPNNQILYLELHAPGPSREDKRRQILAGLVGRTPYDVEDLAFDWSGKGATVKVAVVARETLNEAEDFAVAHRLNPVSFVAIPEEGTFVGEAWFGPSSAADTILAPGEVVERDRDAVSVIAAATVAPIPEPAPPPEAPAEPAAPQEDEPLPGLQEALEAEVTEADLAMEAPVKPDPVAMDIDDQADPFANEFEAELAPVAPERVAPEHVATPDPIAAEPAPATEVSLAEPEPEKIAPLPETAAEIEEAPFAHVEDSAAFPDDNASDPVAPPAPAPSVLATELPDADVPPAPAAAALFAFSSRRSATPDGKPSPVAPSLPPGPPDARFSAPLTRPAPPARTFPGLVTAPSIPGTRAKPKSKPAAEVPRPAGLGPVTVKSPTRPGGTFGAAAPPRNRSGFIFMIMVGLLLLSLALVAAWASFFLTQAADGTDDATVTELAADLIDVPAIEDEMAADLQDPEELAALVPDVAVAEVDSESDLAVDISAEDLAISDLAVEDLPVNIGGDETGLPPTSSVADAVAEGAADPALVEDLAAATDAPLTELAESARDLAEEPAPARTIATEVSGDLLPVEDQDEIFLSAMDAPPPALDALALPAPVATSDAPPDAPMPPPAFGTVYQFGSDGLLKPTPDGILSPAGIMLIAGKPPLLPPARSPVAEAAAAAAAPAPVAPTDPASVPATAADASLVTAGDALPETLPEPDPAMAAFRPRPRPEGLVPAPVSDDDGASLEPEVPGTEITLRPLPRPTIVLAAAAAARPAGADSSVADLGAQGASLAAQAEAKLAAAEAIEAANPSIVAISMRPAARPTDLSRAVEAAVAAAVRAPEPEVELVAAAPESSPEAEAYDEPEVEGSAPSIPTKASVAKQATYKNAINLSKINLIGTYGTASGRYALIRQANGKYKKVRVGDKIDGGVVKAITETEVRYQKGGKLVSLAMPKA